MLFKIVLFPLSDWKIHILDKDANRTFKIKPELAGACKPQS